MNLEDARKKYHKKLPKEILDSYVEPDEFFIVNDKDPTLKPIKIRLEKVIGYVHQFFGREYMGIPVWDKIEGFGLHAKDQKYKRQEYPKRLLTLEKRVTTDLLIKQSKDDNKRATYQKIMKAIYDELNYKARDYKEEISWIKDQWYYRLFGQWVFIKGKPTWIPPWHFYYLNYWHMSDVGYPDYRDADRRSYLFYTYSYLTTETFANLDKDGEAIPDENGEYEMVDLHKRVCLGDIYPKPRQFGFTTQADNIIYCIISITTGEESWGGMQSYTERHVKDNFTKKLIPAFKKMPWFFKPLWNGSATPAKSLTFLRPGSDPIGLELGSEINFSTTASASFYDGKKLYAYLSDESGKTPHILVSERWNTLKPCFGRGDHVHGFSLHPSTVEDMEEDNGIEFFNMCTDSMFYNRNKMDGQTKTGLFCIFRPAYDGLEGFIDEYGDSVVDDPTPEQAKFIKKSYGAMEYLQSKRDEYLKEGTPEAKAEYRAYIKKFPIIFDECFLGATGEIGFDIQKLDKRSTELRSDKDATIQGNFYWQLEGVPQLISAKEFIEKEWHTKKLKGNVIFKPEDNGRWYLSKRLNVGEHNQKIMKYVIDPIKKEKVMAFAPKNPEKFTSSADPFLFSTKSEARLKKGDKMSDGGGAVFYNRDFVLDPEAKPIQDWVSYCFVADYRFRPSSDDEFAEDMLMGSVYFGAMHYPENNVRTTIKYFIQRGYWGYLKYDVDEVTGDIKDTPGFRTTGSTAGNSKQALFNVLRDYIEHRVHVDKHINIWTECRKIRNMDEMHSYDLLTAAGGCLLGAQSIYDKLLKQSQETKNVKFSQRQVVC